jgi:hypothetical protein
MDEFLIFLLYHTDGVLVGGSRKEVVLFTCSLPGNFTNLS